MNQNVNILHYYYYYYYWPKILKIKEELHDKLHDLQEVKQWAFRAHVFKMSCLIFVTVGQATCHRYITSAFDCLFLLGECHSVCLAQVGIRTWYIPVYMTCLVETIVTLCIVYLWWNNYHAQLLTCTTSLEARIACNRYLTRQLVFV